MSITGWIMKKLSSSFAIIILLVFVFSAYGQSNTSIEKSLVSDLKEIEKWSSYGSNFDDDKLNAANEKFEKDILKFTKVAATLKHPFKELTKEIDIETSADGRFRVYSWDMLTGGTMHFYRTLYQFRRGDGKVDSYVNDLGEEGDPGSYVQDIYQVQAAKGNVYLVCTTARLSNPDRYSSVAAYAIEGNKLNDKVKIFKTASGLTNAISFSYSAFSAMDVGMEGNLIRYNSATKTLKIPVVRQSDMSVGDVTKHNISYKFNGTYFVKVK